MKTAIERILTKWKSVHEWQYYTSVLFFSGYAIMNPDIIRFAVKTVPLLDTNEDAILMCVCVDAHKYNYMQHFFTFLSCEHTQIIYYTFIFTCVCACALAFDNSALTICYSKTLMTMDDKTPKMKKIKVALSNYNG